LFDELLLKNNLKEDSLVSMIFSVTRDLDAKNPASALREEGRAAETALFVTQEAYFPGTLERIIRVLVHCYMDASQTPVHVYRNGAEVLRPDRK
jgi:chorismate mutase